QQQEQHRADQLHARRQTRQPAAVLERRDVGQQRGVGVDGQVEKDREQENRERQSRQRVDEPGRDEKRRRQRNADQDERRAPADSRPDAVGIGANRRLDDRPLEAAGAGQQPDEQIRRSERLQDRREDEVVERVKRAGADRAGGVKQRRPARQATHQAQ